MTQETQDIYRERISEAIGNKNYTKNKAAVISGISPANFNKMLEGKQKITEATLKKISRALNVSLDWLTGVSDALCPPLGGESEAEIDREVFSRPSTDKGESRDEVIELLRKTIADKDEEIRFLRSLLQKRED